MVWIGECHAAVARRTLPPGTLARGFGDLAWLATPAPQAGEQQFAAKKNGVLCRAPLSLALKNYRFFAAFFFAPLAAFFAIVLSLGLATQPPTVRLAVTTGGLSHPPSYQM